MGPCVQMIYFVGMKRYFTCNEQWKSTQTVPTQSDILKGLEVGKLTKSKNQVRERRILKVVICLLVTKTWRTQSQKKCLQVLTILVIEKMLIAL